MRSIINWRALQFDAVMQNSNFHCEKDCAFCETCSGSCDRDAYFLNILSGYEEWLCVACSQKI